MAKMKNDQEPTPEQTEQQKEYQRLLAAVTTKEAEVQRHTKAASDAAKLKRLAEKELAALRSQAMTLAARLFAN